MRFALAKGVLSLLMLSVTVFAEAATINHVRMWPAPDHTRLVFDLSGPADHTLFTLKEPARVVIDMSSAEFSAQLPDLAENSSFIREIRYARRGDDGLRVVLDLNRDVKPKSFALKPHREYGHRLVIDLFDVDEDKPNTPIKRDIPNPEQPRDIIVAIDAGHGGDDPGAIGRRGTREKTVVLAIARYLKGYIDGEPGMKAVMIRDGDYFVSLKNRVIKARRAQADLFISIHADAFRDRRARGSSVYVLSENGASSEVARVLAESENDSDLIGGVNLDDKGDLLKLVLVDMVKNNTMEDSHAAARHMLNDMRGITHLHKRRVEQAGFRVLKAPDIPSVLIETAFISNPSEERKLRSSRHQKQMAQAIFKGTLRYFRDNPPPGTLLALPARKHRIQRGDTLSQIAEKYQVSVVTLKQANNLKNDYLRVGQELRIPYYQQNDS